MELYMCCELQVEAANVVSQNRLRQAVGQKSGTGNC